MIHKLLFGVFGFWNLFEIWSLVLVIYLEFVVWNFIKFAIMAEPVKVNIVDKKTIFVKYDDGIEGEYSLVNIGKTTDEKIEINEFTKDISVGDISICKNALYKQLSMKALMKRLKIDLDKL